LRGLLPLLAARSLTALQRCPQLGEDIIRLDARVGARLWSWPGKLFTAGTRESVCLGGQHVAV